MYHYNGQNDASRRLRLDLDDPAILGAVLEGLYKGEKQDFIHLTCREGLSMYNPPDWVSLSLDRPIFLRYDVLTELSSVSPNRSGGR